MKILLGSPIHADALSKLGKNHELVEAYDESQEVLKSLIPDCDVLIFRSGVKITADVMAQAQNLRLVIRAGSGLDNIDVDYVMQHGIRLLRIPGPGAKAVAELTFGLMINLARNIKVADDLLRQGHWAKHEMTGYLLTGKTLGIIGTGNIGRRVARLGLAWDMKVIGCDEIYSETLANELKALGIQLTTLDTVLRESDFVSLHVPKTPSTIHMINEQTISRMKKGAYLVNMARGGIVDEQALCQALVSGHLGGAALDVHETEGEGKISPLAGLKNVLLTPHIGAGTYDSQWEIGQIVVAKVQEFVAEESALAPGSGLLRVATVQIADYFNS